MQAPIKHIFPQHCMTTGNILQGMRGDVTVPPLLLIQIQVSCCVLMSGELWFNCSQLRKCLQSEDICIDHLFSPGWKQTFYKQIDASFCFSHYYVWSCGHHKKKTGKWLWYKMVLGEQLTHLFICQIHKTTTVCMRWKFLVFCGSVRIKNVVSLNIFSSSLLHLPLFSSFVFSFLPFWHHCVCVCLCVY